MESTITKKVKTKAPRRHILPRRDPGERIVFLLAFLVFSCVALFYLYIPIWTFIAGAKDSTDVVMDPFSLPKTWHLEHYIEIFDYFEVNDSNYWNMLFNSLYFSVLGGLIGVSTTSMFAYAASKYTFPGSKLIYPLILIMATLPIYGSGGSMYLVLKKLGMVDSYSHILLAFAGMNFNCLYFQAVYGGLTDTYREAAVIDGANDWQVYFKIMLPQARNLFLSLFLLSWVGDWNNYSSILVYLPNIPTLAGGIYLAETQMIYDVRYDMIYAAYFVSAIPPLVLFAFFSDTLTNSISIGGVKE